MSALNDLPNISRVIAGDLQKAGISAAEELRSIGSRESFILIRLHSDNSACLSKLYALEGAVQGIRWHSLTDETKNELKLFYKSLKK